LKDIAVELFDEYELPASFTQSEYPEIIARFPLFDDSKVYLMPTLADSYYHRICLNRWKAVKEETLTPVEHKPIDVSSVKWWMKTEAIEFNVALLHGRADRYFDFGMWLRSGVIDFMRLFNIPKFFSVLKNHFILQENWNYYDVVVLQKKERTEIEIEKLTLVNLKCDENGYFSRDVGVNVLGNAFLDVCLKNGEILEIPMYRNGVLVGEIGMNVCSLFDLNCVFIEAQSVNFDCK
jgi:hypothetical protein